MQYLLLVYLDDRRFAALTKEQQDRVHADCSVWHEELVKSGHTKGGVGLQPISTATTLREEQGKVVITDGPFAETKEVLGGFETIECQDLDEAIAIAKRFPGLSAGGAVEVRPVVPDGKCDEVDYTRKT